jgi:hypothetical protein
MDMAANDNGIVIDCTACPRREAGECDDCLVAWLLDRPEGAVVINVAEARALRALKEGGLLPELRFGDLTG